MGRGVTVLFKLFNNKLLCCLHNNLPIRIHNKPPLIFRILLSFAVLSTLLILSLSIPLNTRTRSRNHVALHPAHICFGSHLRSSFHSLAALRKWFLYFKFGDCIHSLNTICDWKSIALAYGMYSFIQTDKQLIRILIYNSISEILDSNQKLEFG